MAVKKMAIDKINSHILIGADGCFFMDGGKVLIKKKTVCFITHNYHSCESVRQQLIHYLNRYIDVKTWYTPDEIPFAEIFASDLYILASGPVYREVKERLPAGKKTIIANRTLDVENLDEVLSLPPGTEVLVLGSWKETAMEKINLLQGFGMDKIKFHPYWHDCQVYPRHVQIAIDTGMHSAPPEIKRVINIGVRTLNLSTFVELIVELGLPREIVNDISQHYISTIVYSVVRRLKIAEQSENLKRRLQVILDRVDEAIIATDENQRIVVFNPAAEKQLGIGAELAVGKDAGELIPEIDLHGVYQTRETVVDSIHRINNSYYIVNICPIVDQINMVTGAVFTLKPITEVQELDTKVRRELRRRGNIAKYTFKDIIGETGEIKRAIEVARRFAATDLTILIGGASGTGKELFAQAIHLSSPRKHAPFVAINFAALPDSLVESELFGYEEGAFTGAKKGGKPGLFEDAHTGTIFLDEIGDASPEVQKRLLRVLEEKEIRRVGSSTITPINVRVIAATNQDLRSLVKLGKFREDLYYRLCTVEVDVPSLSDRKDDIPLLICFFGKKLYQRELRLAPDAFRFLQNYPWPGNIRELQNVVNFIGGVTGSQEVVMMGHLPHYLLRERKIATGSAASSTVMEEGVPEDLLREFDRMGALECLKVMIDTFTHEAVFDRGVGRQMLVRTLAHRNLPCPEHKVRLLLKRLTQAGYITVGKTRQGSVLTSTGKELKAYMEKHPAQR